MRDEPDMLISDLALRRAVVLAWEHLPYHVKWDVERRVRFVEGGVIGGAIAQAAADGVIYLAPTLGRQNESAAAAIIHHEIAHVAGGHHAKIAAGVMSFADAEVDAERLAESWDRDLYTMRRLFYGR